MFKQTDRQKHKVKKKEKNESKELRRQTTKKK